MQRKLLLALFFLCGISFLIHEVCWVRQATLTFGVSIYAYSAVLTAYMGGMAVGGYLIGKRADRAEHPLHLFAWLQVGLAGLGILTPFVLNGLTTLYAAVARSLTPGLTVLMVLRLGMSLLALTPPAICIGATLPVMSRVYVRRSGQVGHDVGRLYAVNTLGSVLGCALAATVFIRLLGLRGAVCLAALINLLVAGAAWWLTRGGAETARPQPSLARTKRSKTPPQTPAALCFVLWAYTLSGFASLGYEVVWARVISLHTVGAVYSFSIMLTVFLSGLFVGGLVGTWWVRRRRASVIHFGGLELGIGLLAVLALFAFAQLPSFRLENFFSEYSVAAEITFEGLLSFATLFPVTVLIGAVFPVASSLYTDERAEQVGLKVARVTALNTAGSVLGSLLTGFVIVPTLGLQNSALAFETFYQLENAFLPYNRSGVLFPRRIKGKYALLSRPSDTGHTPFGDIFYSESPDMIHWGCHRFVMKPVGDWQGTKVGAGLTPIETTEGWLMIYHGVLTSCNGFVYSAGAALLDLEQPWRVMYRTAPYLLAPKMNYECVGDVPNMVFPCAALRDAPTGRIAIYYGGADTVTCLAYTQVDELIDFVKSNSM